jgi:hypothetical protein
MTFIRSEVARLNRCSFYAHAPKTQLDIPNLYTVYSD